MTQWCIVAIPEEDDPVWRLSSEKIPHMTLLFLGEQNDSELAMSIATQLQHTVATSLTAFSTSVHSRGVLGDEHADVLFFDQAEIPKQVVEFRSFLLKDDSIRRCYDAREQYPSWTPHLTMGYPTRPAKKPKEFEPNTIRYVYFDRIALWIDDYDGPTFQLGYRRSYDTADAPAMAMSDKSREFLMHRKVEPKPFDPSYLKLPTPSNLKHYGVGVMGRNYRNPIPSALLPALRRTLQSTAAISDDIRYLKHAEAGGLQIDSPNPVRDQYIRENQVAFIEHLKHAVGGRPSEKADILYDVSVNPNGDWILSTVNTAAHTGTVETYIRPLTDDRGIIVDYKVIHDDVSQDDLRYAIMHHGVKGMRWGIRRKPKGDGSGSEDAPSRRQIRKDLKAAAKEATPSKADKIKAQEQAKLNRKAEKKQARGEILKRPVTEDAAVAAKGRGRVKAHGTDAMSNKELQALVQRMNLEQQYASLKENEKAAKGRTGARGYVNDLLKDVGRDLASEAIKYAATEGVKYAFNQSKNSAQNRRQKNSYEWLNPPAIEPSRRALMR